MTDENDPPVDPATVLMQQASGYALHEGMNRYGMTRVLLGVMVAVHVAVGAVPFVRGNATWLQIFVGARGPRLLTRFGAQAGDQIQDGEVWRLISTMFLHGDALHMLLNGVAFLALGRLCEAVYGSVRFLWLFLVAGVCGSALSFLGGNALSVGASGGIFGLLGAAVVFGWRYRHKLPPGASDFFRMRLLPWVALNLFIGAVIPFIDNLGHTGGLIGGAVMAALIGNRVVPGEEGTARGKVWMASVSFAILAWAALGVGRQW